MDDIDRAILNEIQSDFPITLRPFKELGERLGLTETAVLERVRGLKDSGIIRRIGGNFHSSRLEHTSTLCAAKVPEEKIEDFVEVVNRYPGVTHNYLRNNTYNVWFTFIAPSMEEIEACLEEIAGETGVSEIRNLPAVKMFKVRVDFPVEPFSLCRGGQLSSSAYLSIYSWYSASLISPISTRSSPIPSRRRLSMAMIVAGRFLVRL
jgi:DNA-binding Lrp family transcriptional regulator